MRPATAFAPGSIGNVGPGFDVLGLAVDGLGDRVRIELTDGPSRIESITGRDAELIPRDAKRNTAAIAATAWLRAAGIASNVTIHLEKGLPLSGGLGGSGASSVAGAYAAAVASGQTAPDMRSIIAAALEAEQTVSGRHLDNIAATALGGLTLVRSADPIDVIRLPVPDRWRVVLVTPKARVETRAARAVLPEEWAQASWVQQMANTAALAHAFATADEELARRALEDLYAEPRRSTFIPRFHLIKRAALENGSFGCSISGSGPTIFALVTGADAARCADAVREALGDVGGEIQVAPIARKGVRIL